MGIRERLVNGLEVVESKSKAVAKSAKKKLEKVDWKTIRVERLTRYCNEMFASAIEKCHGKMKSVQVVIEELL